MDSVEADATRTEVPASRGKTFLLVLLAACFVAFGAWLLTLDAEFIRSQRRFNSPTLIVVVAWITISFFGIACLAGIWRLLSSKPGLVLSDSGIEIIAFGRHTTVPWEDIAGFSIFELKRTRMLVPVLKDPHTYIEDGGAIRRAVARANYKICGSPIAISSDTVKLSFDELTSLVVSYFERYGVLDD